MDSRELRVYFAIAENRQPIRFVECKWADEDVHPPLRYTKARFPKADFWQITAEGSKDYRTTDGIRICPAPTFLIQLC